MSRSRKDGRKGGAHRSRNGDEVWSRRCPDVNMWPRRRTRGHITFKRITHRFERRMAHNLVVELAQESA